MTQPWKMNLNKIPDSIKDSVFQLRETNIVVSCLLKISTENILSGVFQHINIRIVDGRLEYPHRMLPNPVRGRYSRYNLFGHEVVYRDEPMVYKTFSMDTPNFGDWEKGTHEVSWDRKVYKRGFIGPKYLELTMEFLGIDNKNNHIFKFTIDDILNINISNFWDDLLFDLNLLQENVGNHGVYRTDANLNDYLKSLYVNWEILPPGELDDNVTRILSGVSSTDPRLRQRITDRFKFILSLKPQNIIQGTSRFQRYFGAKFADDLVVFENVEYGNAIYVMTGNWEELSQKSRTELLSTSNSDFIRIPHTKTWKLRLRTIVKKELRIRKAR